jgi:hypothetical protein
MERSITEARAGELNASARTAFNEDLIFMETEIQFDVNSQSNCFCFLSPELAPDGSIAFGAVSPDPP